MGGENQCELVHISGIFSGARRDVTGEVSGVVADAGQHDEFNRDSHCSPRKYIPGTAVMPLT